MVVEDVVAVVVVPPLKALGRPQIDAGRSEGLEWASLLSVVAVVTIDSGVEVVET